jgi:hypothetical protein
VPFLTKKRKSRKRNKKVRKRKKNDPATELKKRNTIPIEEPPGQIPGGSLMSEAGHLSHQGQGGGSFPEYFINKSVIDRE